MIAAFQRRPLIVSLAVVATVLAVIVAIELGLGAGLRSALTPEAKRASAVEAKLLPPVIATAPEQSYPELATRPLFTPTRRPAPEAAVVAKSTFVPGQFVLQGVIAAGDTRIAMLREKANGRIHRVERGREVNGIEVTEIQRETVTLAQGGEKEVLTLQVQRPTGAPPPPVPAGPFAAPPTASVAPAGAQPVAAGEQPATQPVPLAATPRPGTSPALRSGGPMPATPATPAANPTAREPTAAPMSPEELLARRRARRSQQTQ